MRPIVVILVAALSIAVGRDGHAGARRHHPVRAAAHKAHVIKHRARDRVRHSSAPRAHYSDELALTPLLMRQLQRNLVDGGYYSGPIDGALSHRTRRALVDFQREYHLRQSGHVDRATAEALLGHDTIASAGSTSTRL